MGDADPKDPQDARRAVIARRARFVAAAIASAGLANSDACRPQPCLSAVYVPPEGGAPQPCLSVLPHPDDAASDAGVADAGKDGGKTPNGVR